MSTAPLGNPAYKTILADILPPQLSKSDRRRLAILEATIETYSNIKIDYISYEDIARKGKMNRPLIQHYFPNKKKLFELSIKLVRAQFQELAVQAIRKHSSPRDQIQAYIASTFDWIVLLPEHGRIWLLYFYFCHGDAKLRQKHQELTEMGSQRLQLMLSNYYESIKQVPKALELRAKTIQRLITGGLIEITTETGLAEVRSVRDQVITVCMNLL